MSRALCAHHQEVKKYYTASDIVTLKQVSGLKYNTPDGRLQSVTIPDAV